MQKIKGIERIIFLKLFTAEILNYFIKEQKIRKAIQFERTKIKLTRPFEASSNITLTPPILQKENNKSLPIIEIDKQKLKKRVMQQKPLAQMFQQVRNPNKILKEKEIPIEIIKATTPEPEPLPKGFSLGKIENLLRDQLISQIECPGPGKNILIKKYNKVNFTKITLTDSEINEIINKFAKESKIPIAGGILKAAVGNMIIYAITSELVGSRFIISRIG